MQKESMVHLGQVDKSAVGDLGGGRQKNRPPVCFPLSVPLSVSVSGIVGIFKNDTYVAKRA